MKTGSRKGLRGWLEGCALTQSQRNDMGLGIQEKPSATVLIRLAAQWELSGADGIKGSGFCHWLFWDSFRDHKG